MGEIKEIEIPEIKLEQINVTIVGRTPLIVNRFGEKAIKQIENKQQKRAESALKKEARNPQEEFYDSLYFIDKDREIYGFPATGIKKALVCAGGRFTTETMTKLRGTINILGDLLEIKGSKPKMRSDTVRIGMSQTKTASIAYRPYFWPWEITVPVIYNSIAITMEQIVNLFNIAGFAVGIGNWRPECNGTFGQFQIKEVIEV